MAQLPIDEAINRFKDNEVRFDDFVNDSTGYNRDNGAPVESIPAFLNRIESEISATGVIAITEANKTASEAAKNIALTAQAGAQTARDAAVTAKGDAITARNDAVAAAAGASLSIVGKATKAELDAALAFVDGTIGLVTNDPTATNNGYYRKTGASGAGSWVESSYDRVALLEADNEYTKFLQTAVKKETARLFTGSQLFNGAQWFDGTTTVGATINSGGWKIPAGSTGNQTYNNYEFGFTAAESAALAGRTCRFLVTFNTSVNLLTTIPVFGKAVNITGTAGTLANLRFVALNSTKAIFTFDYTFSGNETKLSAYIQVVNTGALGLDATLYTTGFFYAAMDARGANEAAAALTLGFDARITGAELTQVEEGSAVLPNYQMFAGAVYLPSTMGVSVPAGSSGANSYVNYKIDFARELLRAGDTVSLKLVLKTSDNILIELANQYGVNASGFVDNVAVSNKAVAGTNKVVQSGLNEVTITADYVLAGGLIEQIGVYFQIGVAAAVSALGRSFTFKSFAYSLKAKKLNDNVVIRRISDTAISSGDLKASVSTNGEQLSGAVLRDSGYGLTIPVGQTGSLAYRIFKIDISSIRKFVGSVLRIQMLCKTSNDFDIQSPLQGALYVYYNSGSSSSGEISRNIKKLSPTLWLFEFTYRLAGNETHIAPYFQLQAGAVARTVEGFITYEDLRFVFDNAGYSSGSRGYSPAEQVLEFRESVLQAAISSLSPEPTYSQTVTVKADGTGDFTTLAAAIAATGGGENAYRRVLYKVFEGVYTDTNVTIPNFADVIGIGICENIWFKGELPDSVTPSTIPTVQTLWMNNTTKLKNVKVTARNMRYPIHSDSGASSNRALQEIEDCYIEHIGNQGATDYQTANGGNSNTVWPYERAWGCGTHSGQKIYSRRSKFVSRTFPFGFHTNGDFSEPCYVELDNSSVICTTDYSGAIVVEPLGSGQPDRLVIKNGCEIRGHLTVSPAPWLSTDIYNQRGDQNSEVEISVSSSSPIAWTSNNGCNVLELRSVDSSTSAVAISGTGADALFGKQPKYIAGGVGYPGRVYSKHAITGNVSGVLLGERLGNCSSVNKTLNIVFDGSVNKTITLNQDYSAMSNATVIASLNTALADGTRAFYEIDPYDNACHITQAEYEKTVLNTGASAILRGMGVALDGSQFKGRISTAGDAASLFAGVALENVVAGQRGRVLRRGAHIHQLHIAFVSAPSVAFGDTFGISGTTGQFVEGAAVPLIRCIELRNGYGIFEVL